MAFTSHGDSAIDVCFENVLSDGTHLLPRGIDTDGRPCTRGIQNRGIGCRYRQFSL